MSRHDTNKVTFGNFKMMKNLTKQAENIKQKEHENIDIKAPPTEEGCNGDDN